MAADKRDKIKAASAVAQQVSDALHKALDPFIDAMDENASDAESEPKIVGLLIGFRHFVGQFSGVEAHALESLQNANVIQVEDYAGMVNTSNVLGKAVADLVQEAVNREG